MIGLVIFNDESKVGNEYGEVINLMNPTGRHACFINQEGQKESDFNVGSFVVYDVDDKGLFFYHTKNNRLATKNEINTIKEKSHLV